MALAKSLLLSVLIALISIAIWPHSPRLASLWMLTTSAGLMLWTFGKPWPLRWFSLVPPLAMVSFNYGLQLAFLPLPPLDAKMGIALAAGGVWGWSGPSATGSADRHSTSLPTARCWSCSYGW